MKSLAVCVVLACMLQCFLCSDSPPNFNKLRVTYLKFSGMPMTEANAQYYGWTKLIDGCETDAFFVGKQYALKGDLATLLLFDKSGQIAGIQMAMPSSTRVAKNMRASPFIELNGMLYLTAYFTDVKNVCAAKSDRNTKVIGDRVVLQTSAKTSNAAMTLMEIPLKESDIKANAQTKWVKGKCFYLMGQHYWYDISADMDCEDFFPMFLLFQGGELNGFGWASAGDLSSSRVEHPPQSLLGLFFKSETRPKCLNDDPKRGLTTQHIYLKRVYPWKLC